MKKIFGITSIFLCLVAFNVQSKAQSPCSGVTAEVIPTDPQTGQYNYFGVRVTLSQTFTQAVTVTGVIYEAGQGPSGGTEWTLTIPAGQTRTETANNAYQYGPASGAAVQINNVTPCPPSATTSLGKLNDVGQMHNDYLEFLLSFITAQNIDIRDTNNLKQIIQAKTTEFFQSKAVDISLYSYSINFRDLGGGSISLTESNYSSTRFSILNQLNSLIISYDENNDANFFASLATLQQQALGLSDQTELYTVGVPVTIALYSFNYWKTNAERWSDIFMEQDSIRSPLQTPGDANAVSFNLTRQQEELFSPETSTINNTSHLNLAKAGSTNATFYKNLVNWG